MVGKPGGEGRKKCKKLLMNRRETCGQKRPTKRWTGAFSHFGSEREKRKGEKEETKINGN